MEIARLRELLAEAAEYREQALPFVGQNEAATLHAIAAALPALLDRLEAAEAVVEAARARGVVDVAALRRYDEVRRG